MTLANNIVLYYVNGISKIDTPYFSNESEQRAYFESNKFCEIDDSFCPSFFRNEIQVSSDDLVLSDKVNYLSLYYDGKYYYYFIDDIMYINEGLIRLSLELDTIQTFMFQININSGSIERKFINRFNK